MIKELSSKMCLKNSRAAILLAFFLGLSACSEDINKGNIEKEKVIAEGTISKIEFLQDHKMNASTRTIVYLDTGFVGAIYGFPSLVIGSPAKVRCTIGKQRTTTWCYFHTSDGRVYLLQD